MNRTGPGVGQAITPSERKKGALPRTMTETGIWDLAGLVAGLRRNGVSSGRCEEADMRVTLSLAIGCAVCCTLSASAHHSHGQYLETFQDIEGVVKELHLLTPHSWVYLDVNDATGATQLWALEATSRAGLEKIGVTRESLKMGDRIKARCHPLRDKSNGCLLGFLKAPDGSVKDWDGGNAPAPKDF